MSLFVSVVVECEPEPPEVLPGYLVRGWLLRMMRSRSPQLAQLLHDGVAKLASATEEEREARRRRPMPYTVSPAFPPATADDANHTSRRGWFRVTSLWNDLSEHLLELRPADCGRLALGGYRGSVAGILTSAREHPLALRATAEELAGWAMTVADPPPSVQLAFDSPTFFSGTQGQGHTVFPIPGNVFEDSLATAWSAYSGLPLEPERVVELVEALRVRSFALQSAPMDAPRGSAYAGGKDYANEPGFIGQAEFGVDAHAARELARLMHLLAAFACFSGVGSRTTHGFGQAWAVGVGEPWRARSARAGRPGHQRDTNGR